MTVSRTRDGLATILAAAVLASVAAGSTYAAPIVVGATAPKLTAASTPGEVAFTSVRASDERALALTVGRRPNPALPRVVSGTAMPKPALTLPAALDRRAGYAAQNTCDPTDKPGSTAYGELLKSAYPRGIFGISRSCTEWGTSEHKDGRAVDFMINANVPAQKQIADDIVAWITADNGAVARRLGVMYLIWNRKIWGVYAAESGWQPYSGASPHSDHIHTSLTWDGAMQRTSWWTGVALTTWDEGPCRAYSGELAPVYTARNIADCPAPAAPPRTSHVSVVLGSSGADVTKAQRLLGAGGTGKFDYATWKVLRRWQTSKGIAVTGVLDQKTWSLLEPASLR